jgi:hypothetical protein
VTDGPPSKSNWIVSGVGWPSRDRGDRAPSSEPLIVLAGARPWPVPSRSVAEGQGDGGGPAVHAQFGVAVLEVLSHCVRRDMQSCGDRPVVVAGTHEEEHPLFLLGETSERDGLTCVPDGRVEVRLEEPETVELTWTERSVAKGRLRSTRRVEPGADRRGTMTYSPRPPSRSYSNAALSS